MNTWQNLPLRKALNNQLSANKNTPKQFGVFFCYQILTIQKNMPSYKILIFANNKGS